jgi:two-component system, OmpR family, sensor histidine kinase VicK
MSIADNQNNEDDSERTEMLYGHDEIMRRGLETFAHKMQDTCSEGVVVSYIVTNPLIMNAIRDFANRGGRWRFIVEITRDNITACREIMKYAEVRHLDGIANTFTVNERYYFAHIMQEPDGKLTQAMLSNSKKYVEFQRYIYEALWNRAIPAKHRIREIEEGAKREVLEVIRDPEEIQRISYDFIKSAKREILLIFSNANSFHREFRQSAILLQLLKDIVSDSSGQVKVRILVPIEHKIREIIDELDNHGIIVKDYKNPLQVTAVTTLVVDQAYALVVELQVNNTKEREGGEGEMFQEENIHLATYSNSHYTVLSYVSIFETLWVQHEIHYMRRK